MLYLWMYGWEWNEWWPIEWSEIWSDFGFAIWNSERRLWIALVNKKKFNGQNYPFPYPNQIDGHKMMEKR